MSYATRRPDSAPALPASLRVAYEVLQPRQQTERAKWHITVSVYPCFYDKHLRATVYFCSWIIHVMSQSTLLSVSSVTVLPHCRTEYRLKAVSHSWNNKKNWKQTNKFVLLRRGVWNISACSVRSIIDHLTFVINAWGEVISLSWA